MLSNIIKRPTQIIKNSLDFMNKIKDIIIPEVYIMISLDAVSTYHNVPLAFVKESIKNKWEEIKKYTKIPYDEFSVGSDLLVNSTYF